jgi:DNA-binding HxlR family transcriptional regulator
MRHENYDQPGCPVEVCAEIIGGKWKGKILYFLLNGKKRHGELHKLVLEASTRMLTKQLRELEEDGIVKRKIYAEMPPKVEYSLTKQGQELAPVIDGMRLWGKAFLARWKANESANAEK